MSVNRDWVDWGVWIFSGLLVVVGFLQVLLLYGTLSTVKEQSGVLKQTLIHTHRPTIAVRNFYFSKVRGVGGLYGIKNGIEEGSFATGQFYIVNTGGTRATIREIVCQTYIGEERLPMNRPYEGNEGVKPDKLLMAGQSDVWIFGRQTPLGTDEAQALYFTAKATFFYVLGWIGYIDDLGIYRMTHFCRRFEPSKGRFVAVENPDYEDAD